MKTEIILQIINIVVTFIIGVVVTIHIGTFNYKKKKRDELINDLLLLKQSIYKYQEWHINQIRRIVFHKLLEEIKNLDSYSNDFEFISFFSQNKCTVLSKVYKAFSFKMIDSSIDISENYLAPFLGEYEGNNPYYHLEILSLKLSDRENKKLKNTSEKLKEELDISREKIKMLNLFLSSTDFEKGIEQILGETIEIINNFKMGYITTGETSEQIYFLVIDFYAHIHSNKKELFITMSNISNLTDAYKRLIMKL